MICTDPDCYLAGNEHIGAEDPAPPTKPKVLLTREEVQEIAAKAGDTFIKHWLTDFMRTHGDTNYATRSEVLEAVAYSLNHFAEDTSVEGILGIEK